MAAKRKLAAILSADAVGYCKLMADDDAATLRSLNDARSLFRERIETHGGRIIDTAGDSVLAEFPSAIEAVDCAVEIQRALAERNAQVPEHRCLQFRIAINLGDVLEQGDGTIYGDGVNVAARLQALAEPGRICISGTAFDHVEGKLPVSFQFIGEQQVKNIAKPVRAYCVLVGAQTGKTRPTGASKRHGIAIGAAAVIAVLLVTALSWQMQRPTLDQAQSAADSALAMPNGPTIAVIPFTNISGDSKEDYFSDGLTEDIITELARFRELHVLARNLTFQYKGKTIDIVEVARKLKAHYVLEGSVRRDRERIRITAQLIDASNGSHLWADRFDRASTDIFAVQDEITGQVVGAIAGGWGSVLRQAGRETAGRKDPKALDAYDLVLSASAIEWGHPAAWSEAKRLLEKAIKLDSSYPRARQEHAWLMLMGWIFRLGDTGMTPDEVKLNAIRSVERDPSNPLAHRTAAVGYYFEGQMDSFRRETEIAFSLAPNNADVFAVLGWFHGPPGGWDRAVKLVEKAHRLSPATAGGWYHSALFYNHYVNGRYQDALEIIRQHPTQQICENQAKFIMAYGQLGQPEKAKPYFARCKAEDPLFSSEWMLARFREWNFKEEHIRLYLKGLAKAGYPCASPECPKF